MQSNDEIGADLVRDGQRWMVHDTTTRYFPSLNIYQRGGNGDA